MNRRTDKTATIILLSAILWLVTNTTGTADYHGLEEETVRPTPVSDGQQHTEAAVEADLETQKADVGSSTTSDESVSDDATVPQVAKINEEGKEIPENVQPVESGLVNDWSANAEDKPSVEPAEDTASPDAAMGPIGTSAEERDEVQHQDAESNLPSTPEEFLQVTEPPSVDNVNGEEHLESLDSGLEDGRPEGEEDKQQVSETGNLAGPIVQDVNVDSNIEPILSPTEEPLEPEEETPPPRPDQGVQPPSITVDEEGAEAKDDVAPPSRKEDMPSFDEWKEKMLAQQAEEEKIKQQDLQAQASQPGNGAQAKPKPNINRLNFASATCGAKLLSTNPEAQNPGFILTENKDQYMINPCKARKWFLVELCEPVQVHSIEIGNLELFSSVPESFLVQVSDRYPAKEWAALGTFHARDARTIQTFPVQNELLFVKYLKIEMLSHFGSEHYCPITIIRVFGTTVEDDDADEAAEGDPSDVTEDEDLMDLSEGAEPTNLLASATDTVLSLVKRVLTPGEKEEDDHELKDDVLSLKGQKGNASNLNATAEKAAEPQPCPPDASPSGTPKEPVAALPPDQPQPPDVLTPVPSHSDVDTDSQANGGPQGPEKRDPDLVILIESPNPSLLALLTDCNFCHSALTISTPFDGNTICGYYRALQYSVSCLTEPLIVPPQWGDSRSDFAEPTATLESNASATDSILEPSSVASSADEGSQTEELKKEPIVPSRPIITSSEAVKSASIVPTPTLTKSASAASEARPLDMPSSESKPTEQLAQSTPTESSLPSESSESSSSSSSSSTSQGTLEPKSLSSTCESQSPGSSTECMGPDLVQIRPTQTESVVITEASAVPEKQDPSPEESADLESQDVSSDSLDLPELQDVDALEEPIPDKKPPQLNLTNGLKDIYAEEPSPFESDFDLEAVAPPTGDELQYQRLNSGKKETTYMRLKNRIKALELHLNLSSRYLEELSQRYKREMDEMHSSLNRTISRLTNTSRSAQEKDVQQDEELDTLKETVQNLTQEIRSMQNNMDDVHKQLIERHLFLMLAEATVFILIMAWCTSQQRHPRPIYGPLNPPPLSTPRRHPTKNKAPDPKGFVKGHRRHKSIDSPSRGRSESDPVTLVPRSRDDIDIGKSESEHDVTVIEPNIPLFLSNDVCKNFPRRKKKKKLQRQSWSQQGATAHSAGPHVPKLSRSRSTSELIQPHTGPAQARPSDSSSSQTSVVSSSSSGSSINGHHNNPARNLSADFARHDLHKKSIARSHSPLLNGHRSASNAETLDSLCTRENKTKRAPGVDSARQQHNGGVSNAGWHPAQNGHFAQVKRHWFGSGKVPA